MQYRLSTIFLVFFVVAASLAAFGAWGLFIAAIALIIALLFHLTGRRILTIVGLLGSISLLGFVIGLLLPAIQPAREAGGPNCTVNMKQLGLGLHNYHDAHKHFPPLMIRDKDGKPLYSWMVEILPNLEYEPIYDQLRKDEPWNSPHNALILSQSDVGEFICPRAPRKAKDCSTNYLAIVGPGTLWRSEGMVRLGDLRNESSLTVAVIESIDTKVHWAEPYALTVEEALERMETGKGTRISSAHPRVVNVLFADGSVRGLSIEMPIALWRKLLMGEIKTYDELENWTLEKDDAIPVNMGIDQPLMYMGTNQPPPPPGKWPFLLSIAAWLISLALIFHRAWSSGRNARMPKVDNTAVST
jgi:prepilin-type processing-associated H-X9-DG protein